MQGELRITRKDGRRAETGIAIKPTGSSKLGVVVRGEQQTVRPEMLKRFLLTMGISAGSFLVGVMGHNAISAWFGIEEPVFFAIAVFVCPVAFLVGAVGSRTLAIRRWMAR